MPAANRDSSATQDVFLGSMQPRPDPVSVIAGKSVLIHNSVELVQQASEAKL